MEDTDDLSDTDLQGHTFSDEDDEKSNNELGITVPVFLNKLREMARPLLSLSKGVPSPTKQLRESGNDKLKESRAKKRLFRGRQEPLNSVIERRYGYIPNPRWSKSGPGFGRPFVPQGVKDTDKDGVPGIVFRDRAEERNHCYKEMDFPQLSANEAKLSPVSGSLKQQQNSPKTTKKHISFSDTPEPPRRASTSLLTSTPLQKDDRSVHSAPSPSHLQSSLESTYYSAVESTGSPEPLNASVRSVGSNNTRGSRSLTACMFQSLPSSNSGKKRSKKLAPSPLTTNVGQSFNSSAGAANLNNSNNTSYNSVISNTSWSSVARGSPFPGLASFADDSPALVSEASCKNTSTDSLSNWTHPLKVQTSAANVTGHSDGPGPPCAWGPKPSPNTNGPWSNSMNSPSPPPGQVVGQTTSQDNMDSNVSDNQRKKPRQRKGKNNTNTDNVLIHSPKSGSSPVPWQQNGRQNNSKPKNGAGRGGHSLTLESFLTPQRINDKKGGGQNKKDISMLENRFVEHIPVNPTSPPKKLRPSPIKKLNYSRKDNPVGISEGGDADSIMQKDCDNVVTLREYVRTKPKPIHNSLPEPRSKESPFVKDGKGSGKHTHSKVVMSLNKHFMGDTSMEKRDTFDEDIDDEDDYSSKTANKNVEKFWSEEGFTSPIKRASLQSVNKDNVESLGFHNDEDDIDDAFVGGQFLTPVTKTIRQGLGTDKRQESLMMDDTEYADPLKVQQKPLLLRLAWRYSRYVQKHYVPNLAVELYFVIQLLTCTDVDKTLLEFVEAHCDDVSLFRTIHNGVYFAVQVMKRLRRLYVSLDKSYLELLADSQRIMDFSPSLHHFFVESLENRAKNPMKPATVEHTTFFVEEDGTLSFPDASSCHVFKCQKENFYAFFRHYHDTNSPYDFKIENMIQYVYDGCTAEQNSIVNLMHLAKLFVDHLVLCCVTQRKETVDLLKMIRSKGTDDDLFTTMYEAFFETTNASMGTASPAPGFLDHQMFFRDFLDTLSSPSFNEHLKHLLVAKILELNSQSFGNVRNLHSAQTLEENETPMRCQAFTNSVLALCILAKVLGYLTFSPYSSGCQTLPQTQVGVLINMREMSPLPLPLPLLLKQAFDQGSLSITVPWMVEFLSLMDLMAPQLSVYAALLKRLHYIQSFAWERLYKEGHSNSGLLIVSCISWLFESPSIPAGYFFSCKSFASEFGDQAERHRLLDIDRQKLVTQNLLSSCCPYLDQGQVLLTLFALKQQVPSCDMAVLPLTEPEDDFTSTGKLTDEMADIEKWLGSSLALKEHQQNGLQSKRRNSVIDDEIVPAYVFTRMLAKKDSDGLEDLEHNLLLGDAYMKSAIETTVDLLCAKVADYGQKTILKLLVFTCKAEVRQRFSDVPAPTEAELRKNQILADINISSDRLSCTAKSNFFQVAEKVCDVELVSMLTCLSGVRKEEIQQGFLHVARKMLLYRLAEWAKVQLGPELFRRVISQEAVRCARVPGKAVAVYPQDYMRKIEEYSTPELGPGFVDLAQLSNLIDTALSHGVWYINSLTPGQRPDADHMMNIIKDFTSCVEKNMITMDFAFAVMSNFLMHLIVQYMVDAPANWTPESQEAFLHLCQLCVHHKRDRDRCLMQPSTGPGGRRLKPGIRMNFKLTNFLSVHTLSWLTKSCVQDETLMVYCQLLQGLVLSGLLNIETLCSKLLSSRDNKRLSYEGIMIANRALVKVLALLYSDASSCRPEGKGKTEMEVLDRQGNEICDANYKGSKLQKGGLDGEQNADKHLSVAVLKEQPSVDKHLVNAKHGGGISETYDCERITSLVLGMYKQATSRKNSSQSYKMNADLASKLQHAFGNLL